MNGIAPGAMNPLRPTLIRDHPLSCHTYVNGDKPTAPMSNSNNCLFISLKISSKTVQTTEYSFNMASRAFFDPITLLRAAPLVSSTAALCFSYDQYFFLNNFLRPEHRDEANSLVPSYFATFFMRGLPQLLMFYGVSIGAGAANVWGKPNGASRWFAAGTALAFAHFAFVPKISMLYSLEILTPIYLYTLFLAAGEEADHDCSVACESPL